VSRRPRAFTALAQACAPTPTVQAAGRVALDTRRTNVRPNGWGVGIQRLAPFDFAPPIDIWSREAAMSIPSVSRARDLLCTAVGALPITLWSVRFDVPSRQSIEEQLPPPRWANRLDPNKPRQHTLSWLTDDLFFHGRAYLRITNRYESTTYPATFEWMPFADVGIDATGRVTFLGKPVDPIDVVEFCSPIEGLLYTGYRTIQTAIQLDDAAARFSCNEIPAGWLQQRPDSEPMAAEELTEIAESFGAARAQRVIAALNPYIEWHESTMDPSRLQLVEARQHQALELARLTNIPPYLIGAPQGTGMTYQNTAQAKADLIDFGAMPYIGCIEQTLGGPNVVPNGQAIRLDVNAWLRNPYVPNANASQTDLEIAYNPGPPAPSPQRAPGRPRDVDGLNEGTRP